MEINQPQPEPDNHLDHQPPTDIDFLSEKGKLPLPPKRRLSKISKLLIYAVIIFVVLIFSYSVGILSSSENLAKTFGNVSLLGQLQRLIGSGDRPLDGEQEDRTNVLLLGMGGENHDGPYLSDTMMVMSIKPSTDQVALISLPRDLLAPIPGYGWRKINNANAFGETEPGAGAKLAAQTVSGVLNLPIHYYLRIDFAGFVDIVDALGGVTIDVENKLDDPYYPIPGKENASLDERYEHLVIEVGRHHFDGELALKYVRSRLARGVEGSDFARSQRQQKVLLAIKDKALSFSTLANPVRVSQFMDALSAHLTTNLELWQVMRLFNIVKDVSDESVVNRVFDDSPTGLLVAGSTEDGAFILQPRAGDFSQLQHVARTIFDSEAQQALQPRRIEIQNGTKLEGLAGRTAEYLQSLGYQIIRYKNAPTQDYQKTVVYNLNPDPDPNQTAENVSQLLNAERAGVIPDWVTATTSPSVSPNADILLIIGLDRTQ